MTTQKEIAKILGISPQSISALKKRTRNLSKRKALVLAARTGIPKEELFFADGPELIEKLRTAIESQSQK